MDSPTDAFEVASARTMGSTGEGAVLDRFGRREIALIFSFWTLFGAVMAANILLSPLRQTSPPTSLVAFTYLGAYVWALLTIPMFQVASRISRGSGSLVLRLMKQFLFGMLIAAMVSFAIALVSMISLRDLEGGRLSGLPGLWEIARYRYLNDLLASLLIIAAGIAREYFLRYQARQEEASLLRDQLVAARLETLRTQLNPHFLFNTLNAVSALVAQNPRGVRRIIELLSEMLRYALDGASEAEITVEDEFQILERYLEILEIRYGGRLTTSVVCDQEVAYALVPNLILQPLAENAMKHGLGEVGGRGQIDIHALREDGVLVLRVRDSGNPARPPRLPDHFDGDGSQGGIGLRHTYERLRQMYSERAELRLYPDAEEGTVAEIRIPFHTRDRLPESPRLSLARSNG